MAQPPTQRPPLRTPARPSAPVWSPKSIAIVAVVTVIMVAAMVFLLGHKSLFAKTELSLCIIAGGLFLFLAAGLYHGARLKHEEIDPADLWPDMSFANSDERFDLSGFDLFTPDAEGCAGTVMWLGIGLLLVLLAPVILSLVWGVVTVLILAVFWVFNRALRQVFRHAEQCRHDLPASLTYALVYTILYSGWLIALVGGIHLMHHRPV